MATSKWWHQVEEPSSEWHELRTDEGLTYFHNVRTNETRWDRPRELMTAEHEAQAGAWVWLPDPVDCFLPAKVESPGGAGQKALLRTESGRAVQVTAKEFAAMAKLQWPSLQRVVADLTLLDDMNPALILHNLRQRFERDQIYTNIGTILISVNPYCRLNLYTPEVIDEYENRGLKEMPPHVYSIAQNAITGIKDTTANQSVIVSGESGAGKTEATKQVLSYIAAVSGSTGNVEEKILLANPILETFGNAKTLRNNNSSRFGKYIQVYLNGRGEICGSTTQNFLLEKVRVVNPAPNERNFHVFYQITEACSASDRARWGLGRAADYFYTVQSQCTTVPGIDDHADYNDMLQAMSAIGVTNSERDQLLQSVAAILHLGNVVFESTGDKQCRISNADSLSWAAALFGIDEQRLEFVMTKRTLKIRGQGDTQVSLSDEQAFEARDALAKFVYAALFDWIVARINRSMAVTDSGSRSIGILDIFGFEVFAVNSFEQLCINFTNERLQQFFNANTFKLEEDLYAAEGIAFDHIDFVDNQPMVDLLTKKPYGIMNLLDEEVVVPQGSDVKFLHKIIENHSSNANFRTGPGNNANSFVVVHYAGPVVYDVTGFLEKNRDTLSPDAMQLLNGSSIPFIAQMFASVADMSAKDRKQSLGRQFRNQLDSLMSTLTSTTPHYIRCIKPNEEKKARTFLAKNCYEQLLYSGVFEAVQIRKRGFPFRQKHADFLARYKVIFPERNHTTCETLLRDLALPPENVRIGRTMILYRSDEFKQMELRRSITVRKAEIVEELRVLTQQDPYALPNDAAREKYFERLSKAVRTAVEFNAEHPVCRKGRDLLIAFIESRMDDGTRAMLEEAQQRCDRSLLEAAIKQADQHEYNTKLVRQCKKLLDRVVRVEDETEAALTLLERDHMNAAVSAAREIGYWSETIDYYTQLLGHTPRELLKVQLKQAVAISNVSRAIRLTIKMKDSVFAEKAAMFDLQSCGIVKEAEEWASEKFLTLHRDQLRLDMLSWSKDDLHAPLTRLPDGGNAKEISKAALACFRQVQSFMGDRKSENPSFDGHGLVITGHGRAELRDEIYVQLLKQLTKNPQPDSVRRGWQLLGACLASFPPGEGFENFLEVWLRVNAQNPDYLGALHAICYLGARPVPVELAQLDKITDTLRQRTQEYAEPLPSGPPSYQDLLEPFDANVDELEFKRKAPMGRVGGGGKSTVTATAASGESTSRPTHGRQMSRAQQAVQFTQKKNGLQARISTCRPNAWEAHVDPSTNATYYWNPETGESSWEKPAELKFGVADDVKPRF